MAKATTSTSNRTKAAPKTVKAAAKPKTAAKTTAARKAPPKPATKATPVVVTEKEPVVSAPDLKKVDLVDAVVERSGIKKKFAKPAIEAALAVLGEALADGRSLNLRPLGKVKIQRTKDVSNGKVMTARIRQPLDTKVENEGLADPSVES